MYKALCRDRVESKGLVDAAPEGTSGIADEMRDIGMPVAGSKSV